MEYIKLTLVCAVLLAVCQYGQVQGQGVLQVDPQDGFSQLRKSNTRPSLPLINQQQAAAISALEDVGIQDDQTLEWRLPREVLPVDYRVKIAPNIDDGQEDIIGERWYAPGEVDITVQAQRATLNIVMHSKVATIHSLKVEFPFLTLKIIAYLKPCIIIINQL